MTYKEAKVKQIKRIKEMPLPLCVGYLATIYEDCQCCCYCKKESWLSYGAFSESDSEKIAQEYELKCKNNGTWEKCAERIAFERVMEAVKQ